jgi:hypothetical protein
MGRPPVTVFFAGLTVVAVLMVLATMTAFAAMVAFAWPWRRRRTRPPARCGCWGFPSLHPVRQARVKHGIAKLDAMIIAALSLALCAAGALVLGLGAIVTVEPPRDHPYGASLL